MLLDTSILLAFSFMAFALVVTPGPDTMLVLHRSITGSRSIGLATVAGVQIGLVFHTLLAALGISLLIASNPIVFKGIAVIGSLYLLWLAILSIKGSGISDFTRQLKETTKRRAFIDSMLCNILNPKVILLYLALMPNFVSAELGRVSQQILTLGMVLILINSAWQIPLSITANVACRYLMMPAVQKIMCILTGIILAMFSAFMFYENILDYGNE